MGKILVTGAAGLVGQHICSGLLDKGYEVIGIDAKEDVYNSNKSNFSFYRLSPKIKAQKEQLPQIFETEIVDTVIHSACVADNDIGPEITNKEIEDSAIWDNNYLYKAANLVQVAQFILISTTQLYKTPKTREPVHEDDDLEPITNYAKLKYHAEEALAFEFKKSKTTAVVSARCAPFYVKDFPDNLRSKVIDPKTKEGFVYRTGEYGYHFCNVYNLVDFIISYIKTIEKIKNPEERQVHSGYFNVADKEVISAQRIIEFLRENYVMPPVFKRTENKNVFGKFFHSKPSPELFTDFRFFDEKIATASHRYDVNKCNRICPLRWDIENTK